MNIKPLAVHALRLLTGRMTERRRVRDVGRADYLIVTVKNGRLNIPTQGSFRAVIVGCPACGKISLAFKEHIECLKPLSLRGRMICQNCQFGTVIEGGKFSK